MVLLRRVFIKGLVGFDSKHQGLFIGVLMQCVIAGKLVHLTSGVGRALSRVAFVAPECMSLGSSPAVLSNRRRSQCGAAWTQE